MHFQISHICREGNTCVDKLVDHGITVNTFTWWDSVSSFCIADDMHNRLHFPNYIDFVDTSLLMGVGIVPPYIYIFFYLFLQYNTLAC